MEGWLDPGEEWKELRQLDLDDPSRIGEVKYGLQEVSEEETSSPRNEELDPGWDQVAGLRSVLLLLTIGHL